MCVIHSLFQKLVVKDQKAVKVFAVWPRKHFVGRCNMYVIFGGGNVHSLGMFYCVIDFLLVSVSDHRIEHYSK